MEKDHILLIILASAILFGYCYGIDMPQALQKPLREAPYNFNNFRFNLLYFFTFLPVALLEIPIGVLIDKYSLRYSLFLMLFISLFSQLIASLAFEFLFQGYQWVVYISRSSFGAVGEGVFIIQAIIIANYAKQNYEVIMGICLSLPFVMDAVNSLITTHVYDATQYMALAWYIGTFVTFLSLVAGILVDKFYIKKIMQEMRGKTQEQILQNVGSSTDIKEKLIQQRIKAQHQISVQIQQKFSLKRIGQLSSQFWVLVVAIFFFEACLGPFMDNLNDLMVKRFRIQYVDSGKLLLLPFASLPIFAYAVSRVCFAWPHWRRRIILTNSIAFFVITSIVYLLPNTTVPTFIYFFILTFYMLMIGISFAIYYAAVLTSVSYLVPTQYLGTAFGISSTALGLCQCLVPLVNSAILDQYSTLEDSYEQLSLFGAGLAMFPVLFSLWMMQKQFEALDYNLIDDFISSASMHGTFNGNNLDEVPQQIQSNESEQDPGQQNQKPSQRSRSRSGSGQIEV